MSKNMSWRWRASTVAAGATFVTSALIACSGDNGTGSSTSTVDAASTSSTASSSTTSTGDDGSSSSSSMTDATVNDGPTTETSTNDVRTDTSVSDASEASTPLAPLALCPTLDTDWQFAILVNGGTYPGSSYDDRTTTWATDIVGNVNFFSKLADCRIDGMINANTGFPQDAAANTAEAAYANQMVAWVLQFMGCGLADAGPLSFAGLIPAGAQGHTFTIADLNVISELFVNEVISKASAAWAESAQCDPNSGTCAVDSVGLPVYTPKSPEPLTQAQIDAITAQLAALAAAYPGVNSSTTHLTYTTCVEAGTDGGSDAGIRDAADGG